VTVSLLTNALSASDNVFVHGAYRRYRGPLLAAGARLFEYAPPVGGTGQRDLLHAKVFIIDESTAIVGSLNFDLRSAYTNSEMGIVFDQPELVAELLTFFQGHTTPTQAYTLSMEQGAIRWAVTRPGLPSAYWVEPEAPALWRGLSWVLGRLPIHGWL
jgi:putative cardiolipin synthase